MGRDQVNPDFLFEYCYRQSLEYLDKKSKNRQLRGKVSDQ
ncbi:hypothetical protein Rahaq_0457 [Rahnella aceris]|jgi:hypothetical protein|uniref:Uncharacterized protein n=1 Tax=Rahnella sp. (strain Y9602) TaxID=2703885 RepID=A0A0H3FAM7_RAHSY|nr:hypothetical protein Rahaq_0457 [Rahnella aceris]AFE56721.1 hypothetical protein Q7S_02280 [Rahnella aquatilis HX2]MDP9706553.1 hypothetical protein [Rahnella aquatilis]RKT65201.1 hypothetical protein BJ925_4787 [Rahnella aquatilis]CAH0144924.1 hypothetical protein SRABI106_00309 [Rahnella aquatilis]